MPTTASAPRATRRRSRAGASLFSYALTAAAVVLSLCGAASAKVRNGDDLLRQCTATIGAQMAFCYGYIDSVADVLLESNGIGGFTACITSELDDPSLRDIVVTFLKENPDLHRLDAPELIARALAAAFPCQQRPRN